MRWFGWALIVFMATEWLRVPAMVGDVGAAAACLGLGALFLLALSVEAAAEHIGEAMVRAAESIAKVERQRAEKVDAGG